MNKIFKVVWNEARRAYVVVSEYAKAQGKGCSGKKLLAMLIAAGVLSCPMFNVAEAETLGVATESQYVVIKGSAPNEGDTRTKDIDGYTYNLKSATYNDLKGKPYTVWYWVRDGYTIQAEYNHLYNFDQITGASTDYTISTYKTGTTEDTGLLKSNQVLVTDSGVKTLTDGNINDAKTGTFVGSTNSGGVKAIDTWNYIIYDSDGKYVDASKNMSTYFQEATVDSTTGQYTYNGEVIAPENLYVLTHQETKKVWDKDEQKSVDKVVETQKLGFFTTKDGALYKGSVFGLHNEVLMTAKEGDTLYSYWGAETDDPNQTIGSMRVGQLNDMFTVVENNLKSAMGDDIESIKTEAAEGGNGGTINLIRRGIYNTTTGQYAQKDADENYLPGVAVGLNVKSEGGTGGNDDDMRITITGSDGSANTAITLDAGSKVLANTGTSTTKLTTLSINGTNYAITGQEYEAGDNVTIANGKISAKDTKYKVIATPKTGSTVTEYNIVDASDGTKSIGKIVDTNTKYTVSAAAGTGNVVNTYTLTDSDGNALTQIVDTDTTYEAGTNVEIKDGKIYAKDTTYSAGKGIAIDPANGNKISAKIGTGLKFGDVDEDIIMVDTTNTNLSYKASGDTESKSVSLATGLTFAGDNNIKATTGADGLVKYELDDTLEVTSVTAGNTVLNTSGLTIGTNSSLTASELKVGGKTYIDTNGLNANNQRITGVATGVDATDAVNVAQLNAAISGSSTTDIKSIKTEAATGGNGGTINLIRNDNSSVAGGLTITSGGGNGSDTFITIAGKNGEAASAITLNTGSKVTAVGTTDNLTGVTINGTSYNIKPYIGGGQCYYYW